MPSDPINVNQLLILAMINEGIEKPSEISEKLGMTKQGVFYHIKELRGYGYVDASSRITKSGYNYLARGLGGLSRRISAYMKNLYGSEPWEAVADNSISEGEVVYLTMRKGYLHAGTTSVTGCKGVAVNKASEGEITGVSNIEGLIDLKLGSVKIIVIPSIHGNANEVKNLDEIKRILEKESPDLVGAVGEGGMIIARGAGRLDMEFSAVTAAFEAAARGLSSILLVSEARMRFELANLEEISGKMPEVTFSIKYI